MLQRIVVGFGRGSKKLELSLGVVVYGLLAQFLS